MEASLHSQNGNENHVQFEEIINFKYTDLKFEKSFKESWSRKVKGDKQNLKENEPKVINTPFNFASLPNFLSDPKFLNEVTETLQSLPVIQKNNDLYKFKCTEDLKRIKSSNIQQLCQVIKGPVKKLVQKLTGIQFNKKVSISCSKYDFTDVLLCHDDELEGRRIAFILYLVPPWEKKDGGSLDLFSADDLRRPNAIVERIYPSFNSFAFFEVSAVSFHQVSEILVEDKTRLSVNGWFHGEPIEYPSRPVPKPSVFLSPGDVQENVVYSWINPQYLDQEMQSEIRGNFQEKSEIQLPDFLKKKKYDQLAKALKTEVKGWKWVGPPNKRLLEAASRKYVPDIVQEYLSLIESEAMFLIISQLTGLELHHLAPKSEDDSSSSEAESEHREEELPPTTEVTSGSSNQLSGTCGSSKRPPEEILQSKQPKKKQRKKKRISEAVDCSLPSSNKPVIDYLGGIGGLLDDGWESDIDAEMRLQTRENECRSEHMAEVSCEIRRWRWGAYSLMRDDDLRRNNRDFILDSMIFFNGSPEWKSEYGGVTIYAAEGEDEELLTVIPTPNSLVLVYRDNKTFRFTKHLNIKSKELDEEKSIFHEIFCEYKEIS